MDIDDKCDTYYAKCVVHVISHKVRFVHIPKGTLLSAAYDSDNYIPIRRITTTATTTAFSTASSTSALFSTKAFSRASSKVSSPSAPFSTKAFSTNAVTTLIDVEITTKMGKVSRASPSVYWVGAGIVLVLFVIAGVFAIRRIYKYRREVNIRLRTIKARSYQIRLRKHKQTQEEVNRLSTEL